MVPVARVVWEILPSVLVYLGSPELQRLAKTCSYMHALISYKLHQLYDVDAFLGQFFGCTAEFRFLQACTGLLVSGSQALQFMDRTSFSTSDVDLYVGARAAFVVIDWLILRGFILVSRRSPFRHGSIPIPNRLDYARVPGGRYFLRRGHSLFQFVSPGGYFKVDLIVASQSAFSAICDFHSTAVINFISAECSVSMFARATFVDRLSLTLRSGPGGRIKAVVDKYARRGFNPPSTPADMGSFQPGPRWVRDSSTCWVLPLRPVPSGPFQFWESCPYTLSMFHSAIPRQGMAYWHRMGLRLHTHNLTGTVIFAQFCYDDVHEYCTPPEFLRRQVVYYSSTGFIYQHEMDSIVDAAI